RDEDGEREQADAGVQAGGERGEGAGERDVRQRVRGEDLGPQDEEVPDQPGGERHGGAGEEGVLHERVGQHGAVRTWNRRAAAVNTYPPKATVVSQKPMGYGE